MNIKITLLALLTCVTFYAQNFREIQLPKPNKISPFFIGPIFKSTIHFGATPPNYNGKVIVFNHGYIDLNQTHFLRNNKFYENVYNEGYQAVFVATTRGGGIWKNGKLLAEAIDIATNKYGVEDVYLIAHSNGGKATEAAMIRYRAKDKVKQAFAMGTPFWGTYLADISQAPVVNWVWSLTGLNEGARTSTTYYCRDVVRPYLDNNPRNEPEKFVVLGASGYNKGPNLLNRVALTVSGKIIEKKQGTNDGVAPYRSTLRPNATYVFSENDPRAITDHIHISTGQFSWKYIKPYIDNPSLINQENPSIDYAKNHITTSDFYIIHSDNEYDRITFDKNSTFAIADIIHEKPNADFSIFDKSGKKLPLQKIHKQQDHKTIIPISQNNYTLKSNSRFAAFIKQKNGVIMQLEHQRKQSNPVLTVNLLNNQKEKISSSNIDVRALITRTSTINGTVIDEAPRVISFKAKNDDFILDTKDLDEGVYNIVITGESINNFKRNIISGFVVGDIKKALASVDIKEPTSSTGKSIHISPNSVKDQAQLNLKGYKNTKKININIFDITGRSISSFETIAQLNQSADISKNLQSLPSGIYILQVNNQQTLKFIKE